MTDVIKRDERIKTFSPQTEKFNFKTQNPLKIKKNTKKYPKNHKK